MARLGGLALGLAGGFDRLLALAARLLESGAGRFERGLDLGQCRQARKLGLDGTLLRGDLLAANAEAAQAILQFGDLAAHAVAQRLVVGDLARQAIVFGLGRDRGLVRRVARLLGGGGAIVLAHAILLELRALGVEIGDGGGVALAALFSREIGPGLLQTRPGVLLGGGNTLGLGGERIVRRAQALQGRGGHGFVVAQWRQRGRGIGLRGGG